MIYLSTPTYLVIQTYGKRISKKVSFGLLKVYMNKNTVRYRSLTRYYFILNLLSLLYTMPKVSSCNSAFT